MIAASFQFTWRPTMNVIDATVLNVTPARFFNRIHLVNVAEPEKSEHREHHDSRAGSEKSSIDSNRELSDKRALRKSSSAVTRQLDGARCATRLTPTPERLLKNEQRGCP